MKKTILVIGAGPAGAVASSYLAKNGFDVIVVEKEVFPRFVIGESLLPQCMDSLEEAGLLDYLLTQNFQIKTGATFYNGEKTCTFSFSEQFSKSWDWTWQVQRSKFDLALVDAATENGVKFLFNTEVLDVEIFEEYQTTTTINSNGENISINSKFVIDASGYGRVLPRLFDLNAPSIQKPRGAIFSHLPDSKRTQIDGENIFICSFNNNTSWLWVIPFSDNTCSFGIVSDNKDVENLYLNNAEKFKSFISNFSELNNRFITADFLFEPKMILGYSVGVKKMFGQGYVLCGNSTEFLDPVFSSGVTLATASGLQAAKLVCKQLNGEQVDWQKEYEDKMQMGIEVFRSYINAWYNGNLQRLFFSNEIRQDFKEQICSVLAGHVWDTTNPFVVKHKSILTTLAKIVEIERK